MGAISFVRTTSASCKVANAEAPSAESGPSQNRRRDRRTYQFDRSAISAATRRPAAAVSNASSEAVTSRTDACTSDSSHRSSSGRSAAPGAEAADSGVHAEPPPDDDAFAYSTRNEVVFQYVSSTFRTISSSTDGPIRRCPQGDPDAAKNQRTASAPWEFSSPIGSITLPRCLDILRPCSSTTCPRTTTFSYEDLSNTSVPTAISE